MSYFYPQARAILQVVLDGFGETALDTDPLVIPVLPKEVTIQRNSYRQADSWELVFDAGDLPLDPTLVRAGAAEIYLFGVPGMSDEQRLVSRKETLLADPPSPRSTLDVVGMEVGLPSGKDRFTFGNRPRIAGLFDRASLRLSNDGKWVTLAGQDYTAHLMSLQWPPLAGGRARRIPVGRRLDDLIADLLTEADPTGRLSVDVRGIEDADLPVVGKGETRHHRRGIPVEQNTSYWDVMYKVTTRYGLILFVDGLDVVISRPRNISEQAQTQIKRLAWGRNLEELELERELGKEQAPAIIVQGYDPVTRQTVTVEHPTGFQRETEATFVAGKGGKGKFKSNSKTTTRKSKTGKVTTTVRNRDEFQIVPAYGITDRAVLRQMAENLYTLLGKAERKVNFRTRDLTDLAGADLLGLVSGDAVTIEWSEFNAEFLADTRIPTAAKIEHLIERGFGRAVAQTIAIAFTKLAGLNRPLRLREATIEFSVDDGISIEGELIDFIVIEGAREEGQRTTRRSTRQGRLVDRDGKPIGWSPERATAAARRAGQ